VYKRRLDPLSTTSKDYRIETARLQVEVRTAVPSFSCIAKNE